MDDITDGRNPVRGTWFKARVAAYYVAGFLLIAVPGAALFSLGESVAGGIGGAIGGFAGLFLSWWLIEVPLKAPLTRLLPRGA